MIILLYIYFILNLIICVLFYILSHHDIADAIIDKVRDESNESLLATFRRSVKRNIIGTLLIIILMILFL